MSSTKQIVSTSNAPGAIGPFSQAVVVNDIFVYTCGCVGSDKDTGKLVSGGIVPEIRQVFKNLGAILDASGSNFENVIKATIFLQSLTDFAVVNEEYKKVFTSSYPARSCIEVAKLPLGALVEIEVVALRGPVKHLSSKI